MGTKAVRFNDNEEKEIKEFLENNPFLDFSTLDRLSISKFIENPEIKLKTTKDKKQNNNQRIQ